MDDARVQPAAEARCRPCLFITRWLSLHASTSRPELTRLYVAYGLTGDPDLMAEVAAVAAPADLGRARRAAVEAGIIPASAAPRGQ